MRCLVKKVIFIISFLSLVSILFPISSARVVKNNNCLTINPDANSTSLISNYKIWEATINTRDREALGYYFAKYANDEEELLANNTYNKLLNLFRDCNEPKDFFNVGQKYFKDAEKKNLNALPQSELRLSKIVDAVAKGKELWCHQQAILIATGIKVRFSDYDTTINKFVLKEGYNDFDIHFIRSYDYNGILTIPWRTHVQLTIGRWNGTDCDIEIDTWDEYCGKCYENSVTNSILGLEDSTTGCLNNTNPNECSVLKEGRITSLTQTIITLMNTILNKYN